MLERQSFQAHSLDEDHGHSLSLSHFYEILKRRAFYFAIPFLLIFAIGSLITVTWPATWVSQGTILVSSQEIPSDLVRATVSTLANERIQVIEQRIMTRDNLLAIAKKYQIATNWRAWMSGTDLVDFIRSRTEINPALRMLSSPQQGPQKNAIVFTVGFEYEQPQIATMVANEFITMILSEDVRSRTNFAAETTRFLDQDAKRLESQVSLIDVQVSQLKRRNAEDSTDSTGISPLDEDKSLAMLKQELLLKSATYSDSHPDIIALKRKIEALTKKNSSTNKNVNASQKTAGSADPNAPGIGTLETQALSLKAQLTEATKKLAAARLGESLERGQHSERLEIIEQPALPNKPTSPNRPKIFAFVCAFALMAGGGLVFAAEALNQSIRRRTDLFSVVDSHLVISIPYISTRSEMLRKRNKIILAAGVLAAVILLGLIAIIFLLPPPDIILDKVMRNLFR